MRSLDLGQFLSNGGDFRPANPRAVLYPESNDGCVQSVNYLGIDSPALHQLRRKIEKRYKQINFFQSFSAISKIIEIKIIKLQMSIINLRPFGVIKITFFRIACNELEQCMPVRSLNNILNY